MNLSKIMGSMTLRERRMLNEAVKQRIVESTWDTSSVEYLRAAYEAANASYNQSKTEEDKALADSAYNAYKAAGAAIAPSAQSLIGSTLSKDGKVVFILTEEGWKTTLRISEEQILALVIPAVQEELKKQIRAAKGQGDELHIVKSSLIDPGAANKSNELFLKRDGEEFADPVVIPAEKMAEIMKTHKLKYSNGTDPLRQDTLADTQAALADSSAFSVGAAMLGFKDEIASLDVPLDKLSGFDDLFGTTNDGKIKSAIQKAAGTKHPSSFKIPLSWAMDGSIMKYMSDSILRGVGIGKIEFKLEKTETAPGSSTHSAYFYTASVKLNPKEIAALKAKLGARAAANDSTS